MTNNLTVGNLKDIIIKLTIPGYYGMLGMSIFNIVDTFFVGLIGPEELAAISFTFSIVMFVNLITVGLGIGIASLISRSIGENNNDSAHTTIMTGLTISVILSLIITVVGLLTITPLFTFLGASESTIDLIKSYMIIWYIGCIFLFLNMIMGQIFRGLGDTKTPGRLMIASAVLNGILDPIFIFGIFSIPGLGIAGASLATVISRAIVIVINFYILDKKYNMFNFRNLKIKKMLISSVEIIKIGIPNSLSKVVNPLIIAFVTYLLAHSTGQAAVAGYGAATKVEALVLALAIAFGNTATAVVGQNFGAKKYKRVNEAINIINKYSVAIFALLYIVVFFAAPYLSKLFTDDPGALHVSTLYLRIVALSYGFQSIYQTTAAFLNILRHPYVATVLSFAQFILVLIPISYILVPILNDVGIFIAIGISYVVLGIACYFVDKYILKRLLLI